MSVDHGDRSIASIRRALAGGQNALALDLVRDASAHEDHETAVEVRYLGALASARMGAMEEAQQWLTGLPLGTPMRAELAIESLSLAGRIAKHHFDTLRHTDAARAIAFGKRAIEHYRAAFDAGRSPYPLVNAATMAMLIGNVDLAKTLASEALAMHDGEEPYWAAATRGEALLVLGRVDEAASEYQRARSLVGTNFGDLAAMRRQLALIDTLPARGLLSLLTPPLVVAFCGHMIDHDDRPVARFPAVLEREVAAAIAQRIERLGVAIGFSQAACGSDLLFLEAMQRAGKQTHVVLPCAVADYVEASVAFAGPQWSARFREAIAGATSVTLATEEPLLGDDALFEHASNLIQGMARLRAGELTAQASMLAVLDVSDPGRQAGTAATVNDWRRGGGRIEIIDLASLRGDPVRPTTARAESPSSAVERSQRRTLKSLLFADVQGFSRLPERYTVEFASAFLGTCRRLLDSLEHTAVDANTRGDGIFLVFDRPHEAADFSIRLQRELALLDWPAMHLPATTRARIGLHTGPVFETFDPVMNKPTFYGTHVNRTARLEPVVQPGHIFATEALAATLAATNDRDFACHYIGTIALAKAFGDARVYRLVKAGDHHSPDDGRTGRTRTDDAVAGSRSLGI